MGFFGKFTYSAGAWTSEPPVSEPWLVIDIHDSDIATVTYAPADGATGRFYLGVEPRVYFEDDDASDPVDGQSEAEGFARWLYRVREVNVDPGAVSALPPGADEVDLRMSSSRTPCNGSSA